MSDRESIEQEAYAKVIWGDSPQEVEQWRVDSGFTVHEAKQVVADAIQDRRLEVRRNGMRGICIGIGIFLLGAVPALAMWLFSPILYLKILAALIVVAVFGTYKILEGLSRLSSGHVRGSITDM